MQRARVAPVAPVAEAGSMEDVSDILAGAGSMEDVSDILAGAGSMEDVSDILAEAGSMEDVSDILLEAPAPADSRGGARDAHDASQAPAWDPDRNHRAGVTVADIVSTHVKAGSHADADEPVSCVRRPSVVQRQQRWRKGGNISRRVSHAVQMVLPEHLTFTIDFQALETFRKHPNEESFGAALNNKTSLVTIETFFAVLSVAFAIGDLEGATEAEHLAFRSLLTLCSLVTLFCSNNALLIANVLKEKGEFFKPQLRWWQQEGSWVQVVLLITKLFHVPPGVPAWAVDPKWQLWVFLRLVILASFMREYCPTVRSKLVRTVTKLTKINVANSLVFKWYIKVYPFRIFTAIYVYLVFATGYMVWVVERDDAQAQDEFSGHLAERGYFDYCWMIVATVTTAGYGDLYPVTYAGRVLTTMAMACGVITTSLLIHSISAFMELHTHEARILGYTMKRIVNRDRELAAVTLVQIVWRDHVLIRSGVRKTHSYRFYSALRRWRKAKLTARELNSSGPLGMDIRNVDLQHMLAEIQEDQKRLMEPRGDHRKSTSCDDLSTLATTDHAPRNARDHARLQEHGGAALLRQELTRATSELSTTQKQLIASQQQLITTQQALAKANVALQSATGELARQT